MGRIKYKIVIPLCFIALLILNSCTDLDQTVYSETPESNFWQTEAEIEAGIAPAYLSLTALAQEPMTETVEGPTDEFIIPTRGGDWDDSGWHRDFWRHEMDADNSLINGTWEALYEGVSNVNYALKSINDLEDRPDGIGSTIAELKVLRAFYYFRIMDIFGNAPIVDDFETAPDEVSQSSSEEIYEFIEKEILANINEVSSDVNESTYGKINKWTAYAILAKLYINSEVYTGTSNWQKTSDVLDSIIDSGNYSLAVGYFDNFAVDNGPSSPENIFVVPFDKVNITGEDYQWRTLHYNNDENFNLAEQPVNGYCAPPGFYDIFDQSADEKTVDNKIYKTYKDQRTGQWLVGQQYDELYSYPPDKEVLVEAPDDMKLKDVAADLDLDLNPHFQDLRSNDDEQRLAGARSLKYFPESGAAKYTQSHDWVVLRYADILLMKAEVLVRLHGEGDDDAMDLINQIRERAYNGNSSFDWNTSDVTLGNILEERGRELAWEHWRMNDLIRFEVASGTPYYTGARTPDKSQDPDDHAFIMPIPQKQLSSNSNLEQNPGYN